MDIKRVKGNAAGRSSGSAYANLVTAVGVDPSDAPTVAEQTRNALAQLDKTLAELGSDKTRIIQATVYVTDIGRKAEMDAEWVKWIGADPKNWPQRACVQAALAGKDQVEIVLVAAKKDG
jgi:enamine deaminase RidA (YjgF/YER057c/UK114 family)